MKINIRPVPPRSAWALEQAGLHPLLAQLYAARGVCGADELDTSLTQLLPPSSLKGTAQAAKLLADAIVHNKKICIVADYDCDGASACVVALRGLRLLGAQQLDYIVPDRVQDGYGLSPSIAKRVKAGGAEVLITVDNGIASFDGVACARSLGLQVLVTDHHLCAKVDGQIALPDANVIVNPNQPGCTFASKSIAGVGVIFYVLLALRAELRQRQAFKADAQPKLDQMLPLVALGTVADVVKLDANNRRLVAQGLKRIRQLSLPAGMRALFEVCARAPQNATSFDFGFALGPRINAAGRLSDMTIGIECLLTDDTTQAQTLAQSLDDINRQRRQIEGDMQQQALDAAELLFQDAKPAPSALCVFDPGFHEGVVGIVASRLKERLHRPSFVFAPSGAAGAKDELKGSGRSIAGFHLRDALDLVAKRHPGVLLRFGGHAMAAGCTIAKQQLPLFNQGLCQVAQEWLDEAVLQRQLDTDGPLKAQYRRLDVLDILQAEVWGQGFAEPIFSEELQVLSQRLLADKHLALKLKHQGEPVDGIWFGRTEPLPARARLAFRLDGQSWRGQRQLRFLIAAMESPTQE